jgi:hypothetical protein
MAYKGEPFTEVRSQRTESRLPNLEKQPRLLERAPVELSHRFMQGGERARCFPQLFAANPN